jgi:hypothetical protein
VHITDINHIHVDSIFAYTQDTEDAGVMVCATAFLVIRSATAALLFQTSQTARADTTSQGASAAPVPCLQPATTTGVAAKTGPANALQALMVKIA